MQKFYIGLGFVAVSLLVSACGSSPDPKPNVNSVENLKNVAQKLENDPNSSPEAKTMALGVERKIKEDEDVRDFSEGK